MSPRGCGAGHTYTHFRRCSQGVLLVGTFCLPRPLGQEGSGSRRDYAGKCPLCPRKGGRRGDGKRPGAGCDRRALLHSGRSASCGVLFRRRRLRDPSLTLKLFPSTKAHHSVVVSHLLFVFPKTPFLVLNAFAHYLITGLHTGPSTLGGKGGSKSSGLSVGLRPKCWCEKSVGMSPRRIRHARASAGAACAVGIGG